MKLDTVWNINDNLTKVEYINPLLIVGVIFILIQTIVVISRKKWGLESTVFNFINNHSKPKYPYSLIFFPIGIILMSIGINNILNQYDEIIEIKKEINSSKIKVLRGKVKVEFEQPGTGHTKGDIIHISNKTFHIDEFYMSNFYHNSISNGGFLYNGQEVQIKYIPTLNFEQSQYGDGKIFKIEIIKK